MKNITKKINILFVLAIFFIPVFANAQYGYDDWGYDYSSGYDDSSYNSGYDDWGYDYSSGYDDYNYSSGYDDYNYNSGYDDWGYDYSSGYDDYSYNSGYDDWNYDYSAGYDDWDYDYSTGYDDFSYNSGYDDWDYDYSAGYDDWDYDYSTGYDDWSYGDDYQTDYEYPSNEYSYPYDDDSDYYDYQPNYGDYGFSYNYGGGCGRSYCYEDDDDIIIINPSDNIHVACSVSDTRILEGDRVTYTANVTGGRGSISYDWNGSFDSNSRTFSKTINSSGTYNERITVRDSRGNSDVANCSNVVVDQEDDEDLQVSCSVSDTSISEGDRVTYTANVTGGIGSISYDWNGDVNSSNRTVSVTYNDDGEYDASVTVRDSHGNTDTDDCSTVVVDNDDDDDDDLEVSCRVSDTSIDEGDRVTFTATASGGNSPYTYSWRGDISGSGRTKSYTFDDDGTYEVSVRVTDDDGNIATDDCSAVRVGRDNNNSGTYSSYETNYPTNGNLASIGSVFLNQVPYTGPADVMKGIGFIALILVWSFSVAYLIRKKMNRNAVVRKIEEFKNSNKAQLG